jgi:branched-chain amino acid transport system substrate-binding protein
MLEAVAAAGPDATRESVRDALAATKDFPGVTGVTSFDENGEALKQLTKATVKDGTFVPVE